MKKTWWIVVVIAALYLTPVARAGYACGGYYGGGWGGCYRGGGCYSGGWFGGLGIGLYGGSCGWGLSLGIGLPGLWAGVGFGGCGPVYATPAYVGSAYTSTAGPIEHQDNPPPVPMSAAQMAGHNTRNWTPPPGQTTGPTYFWTAPPSTGSYSDTTP
jgi:hypothetical protein